MNEHFENYLHEVEQRDRPMVRIEKSLPWPHFLYSFSVALCLCGDATSNKSDWTKEIRWRRLGLDQALQLEKQPLWRRIEPQPHRETPDG